MKVRTGSRVLLAGAVALTLLTACGRDEQSGTGTGDGDTSRLRVALSTFGAESFDPIDMSTATAFDILTPIYDSLLGVDDNGQIAPAVAESWDIDPDQRGVTFHLREGMTFHNGEALTADDVKFSLMRWTDPALEASVVPPFAPLMTDPGTDLQVVDDKTLHVRTPNGPAQRFVETVSTQQQHEAYIVPKDYIETEGVENFREHPVGSGPWEFDSHQAGNNIVYKKSPKPHPWRPAPQFEQLELALVPEESTRLAQMKTGEIDIAGISPESVDDIDSACCRVEEVEDAILVHMLYNGSWSKDAGPIADVRVRQALSLAIDRQEIVDQVMGGHGKAIPGTVPGEFFPGMAGLGVADFGGELYDPDRAKALLAEAGYGNGFNIKVYAFEMSGAPFLSSMAEIMLGYWERLGVTGEVLPTDLDTFFDLADAPNLDDRTIGTVNAMRRRHGYAAGQAVNGYFPGETPNASLVGPPGQTIVPDIEGRIAKVVAASGEEQAKLATDFFKEVSGLYIAPSLFYGSALWAVGNRAGEWKTVSGSAQLGLVYETVQPATT